MDQHTLYYNIFLYKNSWPKRTKIKKKINKELRIKKLDKDIYRSSFFSMYQPKHMWVWHLVRVNPLGLRYMSSSSAYGVSTLLNLTLLGLSAHQTQASKVWHFTRPNLFRFGYVLGPNACGSGVLSDLIPSGSYMRQTQVPMSLTSCQTQHPLIQVFSWTSAQNENLESSSPYSLIGQKVL